MKMIWMNVLTIILLNLSFITSSLRLSTSSPPSSFLVNKKLSNIIQTNINNNINNNQNNNINNNNNNINNVNKSPFKKNFQSSIREGLCGALAGSAQVAGLMWLRTTMSYQHRHRLSMKEALKELYLQGGISRFYKGVGFALIQAPVSKFASVAANDFTLLLSQYSNSTKLSVSFTTALGGLLASLMRVALMPIDTCKTVLQVDGTSGFQRLINKVFNGQISVLYQGTAATLFSTFIGHYPWYLVYNSLEKMIPNPKTFRMKIIKSSMIALLATIFTDLVTNGVRVIKTIKQTSLRNKQLSYLDVIRNILNEGGVKDLFIRGLGSRILADCLQTLVFTIIWKLLSSKTRE